MSKPKKVIAVYEIRNTVSGKFYIGSSANLYERWRTHKNKLRAGTHPNPKLQASWNKHGEAAFVFIKTAEFDSIDDMCACEEGLINAHIANPLCCNLSLWQDSPMRGVTGEAHPSYGRKLTDEEKQVLAEATKRQWETSDPRTGHKHSPETRAKISAKIQEALAEGRGGKFIPSEETRKKMSDALKGNQCAKGYKRTEAEREAIRQRTLGNQNWLGKHHTEESKAKMSKRVIELTTNTEFPSLTVVLEQYGLKMFIFRRALKADKPISKGFNKGLHFRYLQSS